MHTLQNCIQHLLAIGEIILGAIKYSKPLMPSGSLQARNEVTSSKHIALLPFSLGTSLAFLLFWVVVSYCCLWKVSCCEILVAVHSCQSATQIKLNFMLLPHHGHVFFLLNPEILQNHYTEVSDFTVEMRLGRLSRSKEGMEQERK